VAATRYPQLCALARAAELVGERWTLLIVRELLLGPRRFTDLRERLDGVSASVLTQRLQALEEASIVARRYLEPPAASTVYELTETGRALEPAVAALMRWGVRFLAATRPRERVEADWLRLALGACARRGPTPPRAFNVHIRQPRGNVVLQVVGSAEGTRVAAGAGPAEATIVTDARTLFGLMSGALTPSTAVREGRVKIEGDVEAIEVFPTLFEV
jgi:DNA-binding HxlR family transcriptional regulator